MREANTIASALHQELCAPTRRSSSTWLIPKTDSSGFVVVPMTASAKREGAKMALKIVFLATTPEGDPACQQSPRENTGETKPAQKSEGHPVTFVTSHFQKRKT